MVPPPCPLPILWSVLGQAVGLQHNVLVVSVRREPALCSQVLTLSSPINILLCPSCRTRLEASKCCLKFSRFGQCYQMW